MPASPDDMLYFVFEGMPMGWTWAMLFCQSAMEAATLQATPSDGAGHGGLIVDGAPAPRLAPGWPIGAVYVDNAFLLGYSAADCAAALSRHRKALSAAELEYHEVCPPSRRLVFIGVEVDLAARVVRNTASRAWRLHSATQALLDIGGCSEKAMQVYMGHVVHAFGLNPLALSRLRDCYRFIGDARPGFKRFGPEVAYELRIVLGLVFVAGVARLDAPWCGVAFCGDASSKGYALAASGPGPDAVRAEGQFLERWRFKAVERDFDEPGPRLRPRAHIAHAGFGSQLLSSMGAPAPRSRTDYKRVRYEMEDREVVGRVPAPSPQLLRADVWHLLVRGAWKFPAAIHVKEARVDLMGLRRLCRCTAAHGCRVLSLTDNLSAACAFDRGRSRDRGLAALVCQAAAYCLGCEMRWCQRYVRSADNPTDDDSRAADRGELLAGQSQLGDEREWRRITSRHLVSACAPPKPSPDQSLLCGRGAPVPNPTLPPPPTSSKSRSIFQGAGSRPKGMHTIPQKAPRLPFRRKFFLELFLVLAAFRGLFVSVGVESSQVSIPGMAAAMICPILLFLGKCVGGSARGVFSGCTSRPLAPSGPLPPTMRDGMSGLVDRPSSAASPSLSCLILVASLGLWRIPGVAACFRSLRSRSLGLGATFLLCVVIFVSLEHTFRSPRAFSDLFVVCRAWLSTVKVGIGTIDCRAQPTAHGRHRWPRHILRSSAAPWRGLVCGVHLLAAAGLLLTMGRVICANGTLVWEDSTPASPVIQSRHCRSVPEGPSEPGLLALAVGSQSPGVGCRDAIGRRRACRARVREIRGATRPKRHYLKGRSVQPSTLARYEKCSQLLIVFVPLGG